MVLRGNGILKCWAVDWSNVGNMAEFGSGSLKMDSGWMRHVSMTHGCAVGHVEIYSKHVENARNYTKVQHWQKVPLVFSNQQTQVYRKLLIIPIDKTSIIGRIQ